MNCLQSNKPAPDGDCWCAVCSATRAVAAPVAMTNAERGLRKLAEVARRSGDDLCWRAADEILGAFGLPVANRTAMPREEFLQNCARYHDALRLGTKYETAVERDTRVRAEALEEAAAWVEAQYPDSDWTRNDFAVGLRNLAKARK